MWDADTFAVLGIVVVAAGYLIRRYVKQPKGGCGCSGCGGCSGDASSGKHGTPLKSKDENDDGGCNCQ